MSLTRRGLRLALLILFLPMPSLAQSPQAEPTITQATASEETAEKRTVAFTGKIHETSPNQLVVQQIGNGQKLKIQPLLTVPGGPETPVSGEGRDKWEKLRRGDLVVVAFRPGPPPETLKVLVLPPTTLGVVAKTMGTTPKKGARSFTGWIKQKEGDLLVVRTPDGAPPSRRKGQTKTFIRTEKSKVELLRDSWDALKKGDRVSIHFEKGDPRPIKSVVVVSRGGEKPLPAGLATRLFDPKYDETVKDVDGIGETKPLPPTLPNRLPHAVKRP